MAYVFTEDEFNAIDKLCSISKLTDGGFYIMQDEEGDFFEDNGIRLSLEEGLFTLADSVMMEDFVEDGSFSQEEMDIVLDVFDRFGIQY